uniref:Uncharacterized protein n=1 Tax=Pararge aegeria TaxID=116150 RepID=S4P265_9NEOP
MYCSLGRYKHTPRFKIGTVPIRCYHRYYSPLDSGYNFPSVCVTLCKIVQNLRECTGEAILPRRVIIY